MCKVIDIKTRTRKNNLNMIDSMKLKIRGKVVSIDEYTNIYALHKLNTNAKYILDSMPMDIFRSMLESNTVNKNQNSEVALDRLLNIDKDVNKDE